EPVAQQNTVAPIVKPTLDVLVAEDNEVNQIVFTQILQMTGWLFQIVKNGAEAVEAWQKYDPAVIIMDVSMPVMNGHQATRKIRELENSTGTHVPIIGVTAHALESDRELCFQVGMDDYLSKPISPEALENKIRHWLDGAVVVSALDGN
ncbi:MAG: response regulator, partial [Oxalobacteraceae bacterium]